MRPMNVSDIMTWRPATIHPDKSLRDALDIMDDLGCHHLPVVSGAGHLVGILSESDCRVALNVAHTERHHWENSEKAFQVRIRTVMTPAPIIVEANVTSDEAARLMLINHIGCLPVMRGETLIGIITRSDILMAFINGQRKQQYALDVTPSAIP